MPGWDDPLLFNLLRLPNSIPLIRSEYMNIIDIFDPVLEFERWLLAFLSHFISDFKALTDEYTAKWSTTKAHSYFSIDKTLQELSAHIGALWIPDFFRALVLVGTPEMIHFFCANVPDFHLVDGHLPAAAKSKDPEMFLEIFSSVEITPLFFSWVLEEDAFQRRFHDVRFRGEFFSKAALEDSKKKSEPSEYLVSVVKGYVVNCTRTEKAAESYSLTIDALIQSGHSSRTDLGILGAEIRDVVIASGQNDLDTFPVLRQFISQPNSFLELEMEEEPGFVQKYFLMYCNSAKRNMHAEKSCVGFTPLMFALHNGLLSIAVELVNAGAQIKHHASCGLSPLELVQRNIAAKHPRVLPRPPLYNREWIAPTISFETDQLMLKILEDALLARGEVIVRHVNDWNEEAEQVALLEIESQTEKPGKSSPNFLHPSHGLCSIYPSLR
jgi:hypothetical protein